jgi:hypothetical protein
MKRVFCRCSMPIVTFLFLLVAGYAANANAQVPMKIITIYNNSKHDTIYPVLAGYSGDVDLWLQAQFNISPSNSFVQTFCNNNPVPGGVVKCPSNGGPSGLPPPLFRAYINLDKGILPGESVSINVPFYTQLADTSGTLGMYSAQFIDWWNAQRIFFYDGKTAITGAYNYNVDQNGKVVGPTPVTPISGAEIPSCAAVNPFNCEAVKVVYYIGPFSTGSIPFQLGEYTFAAAEGPPPGGLKGSGSPFTIDLTKTNFNISAVDGIYMPVAMEAVLEGDPTPEDHEYLGTDERLEKFRKTLDNFKQNGPQNPQWPYYWPSYFTFETCGQIPCIIPHNEPQNGDLPYPLPSIPSTNVVFAESYKIPAPAPPVLSSNTTDDDGLDPMLGSTAQGIVTLWNKCTSSSDDNSDTCKKIRVVFDFFTRNYNVTCGFSGSPSTPTMLTQVYGWAQFANCSPPLVSTPGYSTAIVDFCSLQYNYLLNTKRADIFNPYTELIHETLKSNAYAFSIDDKAAFKSVPSMGKGTSSGLIITLGGPEGLVTRRQAPLPDANTFEQYCH